MDFSFLLEISDGNSEFLKSFISTFEDTTFSQIKKMKNTLDEGDLTDLKKIAHQIKPTTEMLAFETQSFIVNINNDPSSATKDQLNEIIEEADLVLKALQSKFL